MAEWRRVEKIRTHRTEELLGRYRGEIGEVVARFRAAVESESCVKLRMGDGTERLFFESETSSVGDTDT